MKEIKCPYCDGNNVDEVDLIGSDSGCEHSVYRCYSETCGEHFYVFKTIDIVKVEVSKDKWDNYKTVYTK
ncbi:MAG: hypothetical protein ACRC18_06615 [Cetobacterium sp.]